MIATEYLKPDGIFVAFVREFAEIMIGDLQRVGIELVVETREVDTDPPLTKTDRRGEGGTQAIQKRSYHE